MIDWVHQLIVDDISPHTKRSQAVDPFTKILVTLRYLAKGDFYSECGDLHGVSRSTVSRAVGEVSRAINKHLDNIHFPRLDADLARLKKEFYSIAGLPNVLGAIDGTLVPIIAPRGLDEPAYVCRKGYHARNTQAVVDTDLRFTDAVTKWPGSQHDDAIFETCGLKGFLAGANKGWLLGDSGYALKAYLMTPVANPVTNKEINYNTAHCRTRGVVERAFGLLKSRFRCLDKTGGCLPFSPDRAADIIEVCMRLHNLCITYGIPGPEADMDHTCNDDHVVDIQADVNGRNVRQQLIDTLR